MLISPPFLPATGQAADDAALLRDMMVGGLPDDGAFPVSAELAWHGGMHLTAPAQGQGTLPVRAIADGTIVYARKPTPEPSQPAQDDPLNYYKGWTSDGCVVIRHTTEIGEGAHAAITYYSVYMHLSELAAPAAAHATGATIKQGDAIWRKDPVGKAGLIYGASNKIHFEIVFDAANLQNLIGRNPGTALDTSRDGRTDSVWGEVYVVLPSGSGIQTEDMRALQRRAFGLLHQADVGEADDPDAEAKATEAETKAKQHPADKTLKKAASQARSHATQLRTTREQSTQQLTHYGALRTAPTSRTTEKIIVGLRYHLGGCTVTTYKEDGTEIGTALEEANDYEYDLYIEASALYPNSPSAGYELLRFGRKLGPDALSTENTAHWRKINHVGGQGWVDLNVAGTFKFSDADFPPWKRWTFAGDDADGNSRCDSKTIRDLILNEGLACHDESLAPDRLKLDAVQTKLQCAVCQIPSEWDSEKIDERWGWLKQTDATDHTALLTKCLSEDAFGRLKAHITKLAFWKDAGLPEPAWHIHPRKFIEMMRTCGWLSLNEITSLLPRDSYINFPAVSGEVARTSWAHAHGRWQTHYVEFNKAMRRYGFYGSKRQVQLLAQVYIETALVGTMREIGYGQKNKKGKWPAPAMEYYTVFYGRGMMQLTWPSNYDSYQGYRTKTNLPDNAAGNYIDYPTKPPAQVSRLTQTSTHYWKDPRDSSKKVVGSQKLWYPRYDPDLIASNEYNACDSAGFYWVSKDIGSKQTNIIRVADRDFGSASVGRCSELVNGGGYGYHARQAYARYAWRYRSDAVETTATETVRITRNGTTLDVLIDYQRQSP